MTIVEAIPILRDNYAWAIHDGKSAALVDPGESAPILTWLAGRGITLAAILVTHHHADHIGGIPDLVSRYPVPVFGPTRGASPSRPVADGEIVELPGLGWRLAVMDTPGHTRDHVCYVGHGHLFCGDTLFSCGCGRLFEGAPAEMHASLSRLAALPGETLVHCAHEYTLANIAFALEVEPDNPALGAPSRRGAEAAQGRQAHLARQPGHGTGDQSLPALRPGKPGCRGIATWRTPRPPRRGDLRRHPGVERRVLNPEIGNQRAAGLDYRPLCRVEFAITSISCEGFSAPRPLPACV